MNKELKEFVLQNKHLFRDLDISKQIPSLTIIIERVIDYGDLNELRQLYKIVWENKFKQAFLENLIDKDWKPRSRININDWKMIYLLAHRLWLNEKIPLSDIINRAKKTSTFNLKV